MSAEILRLPASAFTPLEKSYTDTNKLLPLYDKIAFNSNVILVGPKGIAKTLSILAWAHQHEVPVVSFDCSEDVRRAHLYGHYIAQGDDTPFVLGPVTTAIEIANEVGRCILTLEEVNALTPQMQKVLNPISDFRRKVELPEIGRVFEVDPDAELWVCGTMNTSVYGGVYDLNDDLKSRFRMIGLEYPKLEAEKHVLVDELGEWNVPPLKVGDNELDIRTGVLSLAHETRQQAMDYSLSTRDVVQILQDVRRCGLADALWMCMGKFEGDDVQTLYKRMKSIFGNKVLGDRAHGLQ